MPTNSQSLKRNRLKRVLMVQSEFERVKREGGTKKQIWKKHFAEKWNIEYRTFINGLKEDARGKLKALEAEIVATDRAKPERERTRVERLKRRVWELEPKEAAALMAYMVQRFPELATAPAPPVAPKRKKPRPQTSGRGK